MLVYRLSRAQYKDELSGLGAAKFGRRWNSKDIEVIYTAQTRALANSEVAVHIPLSILPKDYYIVQIEIPKSVAIREVKQSELPAGWNALPNKPVSQTIGDDFIKDNKYAVLRVPSVVVKDEYNFILNPRHKDFPKIKILSTEPFPFDPRYFQN
ncbi:MAG: RES family NAD+ phosphorylase [Flavobacteriales bacterium]|nr:RES family NAD+ phosphorylase [Flavobacteriales bacterium]